MANYKPDLSGFEQWYQNDNGGAAAYSPSVMLKIILFGYSRDFITSRRIANVCETNITVNKGMNKLTLRARKK